MIFLATCINGTERLVRHELSRKNIEVISGQDKIVRFQGDMDTMMQANLWLRTANRVYIEMERVAVGSFDTLFAAVESCHWSKYIPK